MRKYLFDKPFEKLNQREKLCNLAFFSSLAPSTLNSQPWKFKLENSVIEILPNLSKQQSISDKQGRQMYVSLGAALENLLLASESYGLKCKTEYKTHRNQTSILIKFTNLDPAKQDIQIQEAILSRHTNREPFEKKQLPNGFLSWLKTLNSEDVKISVITNEQKKDELKEILGSSITAAFENKNFTNELSQWIKPSLKKYKEGMPGYNIGVPWLVSFLLPFAIKHKNLAEAQKKRNEKLLKECPAVVIISSKTDTQLDWISVGKIFEKIAVEAEKAGIKNGIFTAPIEIDSFYKDVQKTIDLKWRPQLFFRLGLCNKIPKFSPRIEINNLIIN